MVLDWLHAQADEHAGPNYDLPGRRWPVDPPIGMIEGDGHLNIPTKEEVWQKLRELTKLLSRLRLNGN